MMSYTVYKHTSPSGKVYIGITSKEPKQRWQGGYGYRGNKHFNGAIQKYGWDNIQHEILYTGLTKEEAEAKEIELIAFYCSNNPKYGYNIQNGGNSTGKLSKETRRKISEANKGKIMSEEAKRKISASLTGKAHSIEKGLKIAKAQIGNKRALGSKRTEEQKRKLSAALTGKKHSLEHCINNGAAHMHPVMCLETGKVYVSVKHAAEELNINKNCISHVLNGRNKTAGGYHWKRIDRGVKNDTAHKHVS